MRQSTPRRPPEKRAPSAPGAQHLEAGQLDLGLAVSVYCAESGTLLLPEGVAEMPPAGSGANVTEH